MVTVRAPSGECGGRRIFVAATIAWVSDGEQAKPRRRRGRRRGRRAAGPPDTAAAAAQQQLGRAGKHRARRRRARPGPQPSRTSRAARDAAPDRLRTVHETSAGGLVIDGIDGPKDSQVAALIGRIDRRGRMLWSLPKGHIELGETAEQTAIREVAEETGIQGSVLAALGSIDYWFVTEGRRVHKTVHHYLMRFLGGELSDEDVEVSEVAWVPLQGAAVPAGLRRRAQTRRGRRRADRQAAHRRARRAAAAAAQLAAAARRRRTRTPATDVPTKRAHPSRAGGRTAADQGRDRPPAVPARCCRDCSPCWRC